MSDSEAQEKRIFREFCCFFIEQHSFSAKKNENLAYFNFACLKESKLHISYKKEFSDVNAHTLLFHDFFMRSTFMQLVRHGAMLYEKT